MRAYILEDEPHTRAGLELMINDYCEGVEVVGSGGTLEEGFSDLKRLSPDLVFLDVNLPDGLGYDLVAVVDLAECGFIFTTAYDDYALKAFELGAIHYLLKPIDPIKLKEAVLRAVEIEKKRKEVQTAFLKSHFGSGPEKIAIPILEGLELIDIDEIIYCEANGTYTDVYSTSDEKRTASRTLGRFEELLKDFNFVRIHDKYLVNFKKVVKYIKGRGGQVVMENGDLLGVSIRKKDNLTDLFRSLSA